MKPLETDDLTHKLAIRRATEVDNGKGGYTTDWSDLCMPWGEVIGLAGHESVLEHALQGIAVYRIRIWYREGLLPADQVRYGALDLNIRSVADPFGTRRELVILADTASTR